MLEISAVQWARANTARAQMDVIIEQANSNVQRRVAQNESGINRCLADLKNLASLLAPIVPSPSPSEVSSLSTPSILAVHQALSPLFRAARIFWPLAERFLSEHGDLLSKSDRSTIEDFVKWTSALKPVLEDARIQRLDELERALERSASERTEDQCDWDITLSDGLSDDHPTHRSI